jgi:AcrR family transcriptional regulator
MLDLHPWITRLPMAAPPLSPNSLYRYVTSKDELLQLMFNESALGAENLVIAGDDWRSRLLAWAVIQRDMLDLHPWITRLPMAAPPLSPNSLHFVERGLQALDGTGLADADKLRVIGLLSSYTLNEAKMANDAARAIAAGIQAAQAALEAGGTPEPPFTFEDLLRELVDEQTYPRLYRLAWSTAQSDPPSEREEFLTGIGLILDGVQAMIDRAG